MYKTQNTEFDVMWQMRDGAGYPCRAQATRSVTTGCSHAIGSLQPCARTARHVKHRVVVIRVGIWPSPTASISLFDTPGEAEEQCTKKTQNTEFDVLWQESERMCAHGETQNTTVNTHLALQITVRRVCGCYDLSGKAGAAVTG